MPLTDIPILAKISRVQLALTSPPDDGFGYYQCFTCFHLMDCPVGRAENVLRSEQDAAMTWCPLVAALKVMANMAVAITNEDYASNPISITKGEVILGRVELNGKCYCWLCV